MRKGGGVKLLPKFSETGAYAYKLLNLSKFEILKRLRYNYCTKHIRPKTLVTLLSILEKFPNFNAASKYNSI